MSSQKYMYNVLDYLVEILYFVKEAALRIPQVSPGIGLKFIVQTISATVDLTPNASSNRAMVTDYFELN